MTGHNITRDVQIMQIDFFLHICPFWPLFAYFEFICIFSVYLHILVFFPNFLIFCVTYLNFLPFFCFFLSVLRHFHFSPVQQEAEAD